MSEVPTATATKVAVEATVEQVLKDTESATLSIGENLGDIVKLAESFVAQMQDSLGRVHSDDDAGVTSTLERQCVTVDEFVGEIQETVTSQGEVAARVIEMSKHVAEAAKLVASIAMQSRMLCFNTKIEAGRLGSMGRPFMVIADQMSELSEGIAASNEQITSLSEDLLPLLDEVRGTVDSLADRTSSFNDRFADQRERIHRATVELQQVAETSFVSGDEQLAAIIARSNDSLVALQGQDIVSQRLRGLLDLVDGSSTAKEADGERMAAGEMELF